MTTRTCAEPNQCTSRMAINASDVGIPGARFTSVLALSVAILHGLFISASRLSNDTWSRLFTALSAKSTPWNMEYHNVYCDTGIPYLVPSIVSIIKRAPSELIHMVFGFCDGIELLLQTTPRNMELLARQCDRVPCFPVVEVIPLQPNSLFGAEFTQDNSNM